MPATAVHAATVLGALQNNVTCTDNRTGCVLDSQGRFSRMRTPSPTGSLTTLLSGHRRPHPPWRSTTSLTPWSKGEGITPLVKEVSRTRGAGTHGGKATEMEGSHQ
jgi:hypothetical protein